MASIEIVDIQLSHVFISSIIVDTCMCEAYSNSSQKADTKIIGNAIVYLPHASWLGWILYYFMNFQAFGLVTNPFNLWYLKFKSSKSSLFLVCAGIVDLGTWWDLPKWYKNNNVNIKAWTPIIYINPFLVYYIMIKFLNID